MELVLVSIFGTGCMLIVEFPDLTRLARKLRFAMPGSRRSQLPAQADVAARPLNRAA